MNYGPVNWIELDKNAFDHNAAQYKKIIGNNLLLFVVKANAYGHGMREVADLAQHNKHIDWLGVAALSDALALRVQGITKPLLMMSCIDADPQQAVHKNIDITVYNYDMVNALNAIGLQHDYRFNVHIKIDTGLARLGIIPNQAIIFVKYVQTLSHIIIRGIFSHFTESSKDDQGFTIAQSQQFYRVLQELEREHVTIPIKHLANSAGTSTLSLPQCNLVRCGVGIYGLWASRATRIKTSERYPDFDLIPILTWKARIINIKRVSQGRPVGYDRTFYATRDMTIANVPIGYFDGYDFRLHNKSVVRVGEHYAPIVGRISMNLMTVDITDIPHARLGDELIVMGNYPLINPYELGQLSGNANVREINTRINPQLSRIVTCNEGATTMLGEKAKLTYTNRPH